MTYSPILLFHISAGTLAMLSGAAAILYRKGSPRHRATGKAFVISMLCLAASGAYIGFTRQQTLNGLMGVLTFYLVTTAWWTARKSAGKPGLFDVSASVIALTVGVVLLYFGFEAAGSETGSKEGYPAPAYFIFGSAALLFVAGDVWVIARGGLTGNRRIARHLRRMCIGLFIATGSFFLGQQQVFPELLRSSNLLYIPALLPLAILVFWIFRIRSSNPYEEGTAP